MKKEIEIPKYCPSCSSTLERVKDQIFCRNNDCSAKSAKQVESYAKVMRIKGLGPKTINKLELTSIVDIYSLEEVGVCESIGEKLGIKLLEEINNSKNVEISTFLAACSIPLIGGTAGKKVASIITNPNEINKDICKEAGLGAKATENLVNWVKSVYIPSLSELPINFTTIAQVTKVKDTGISVCITGRVKGYTKSQIEEYLTTLGISVTSGVNKNTSYLICDDLKGSSKENKANQLNVKIVTFEQLKGIYKND